MRVRVPPIEMDSELFQKLNDYVEREQRAAVQAGGRRLDVSRQKVIEMAVKDYLGRREKAAERSRKKMNSNSQPENMRTV